MYSFEFRKYDNFSTLLELSPNCAIERNAYRSVEFESINFVQVIGLADFDALYRARSSLMLYKKRKTKKTSTLVFGNS